MSEDHVTPASAATVPAYSNNLGIPIAIVVAAALIAGAIYLGGGNSSKTAGVNIPNPDDLAAGAVTAEKVVAPVTKDDHIRGNPNAPIVIVEYSDYDCPFCKNFHETMNQIMAEYGAGGKVAWVYRHFPLAQLHPNASKIAAASECVTELAGNDAFWKFSDLVFSERGVNEPTNLARLTEFAQSAGADKSKFELCYNSGKYNDKISADVTAAIAAGAQGTPYSIMMVGNQQGPINGAQPFGTVKQMIDTVIGQLGG